MTTSGHERTKRQIIAIGGASFEAPDKERDKAMYRYLLGLTSKEHARVCFLPQASGESQQYVVGFLDTFAQLGAQPTWLSLFAPPTADLRGFLLSQDMIYVGGGNTKSMLALWREWGVDAILREAWDAGIVLAGLSAGSICWFEQGSTDSIPGPLTPLPCLGFLPGANCPHFNGEPQRRPSFRRMLEQGEIAAGYAADDGVGLHFIGERLERVVASRRDSRAYYLEMTESGVRETPLDAEYLGE